MVEQRFFENPLSHSFIPFPSELNNLEDKLSEKIEKFLIFSKNPKFFKLFDLSQFQTDFCDF